MKKALLSTLSLVLMTSLAACNSGATVPSATSPVISQGWGLPDPSCISMDGAVFAPSTIYVSRFPAPSYPNTGVDASFGSSSATTLNMTLTAPNGINLSWASKNASGQANANGSTTQRFPLLVTASPSLPAGQYSVLMKVTTNYSTYPGCPSQVLTVNVQ